jgi:hypothetical protein
VEFVLEGADEHVADGVPEAADVLLEVEVEIPVDRRPVGVPEPLGTAADGGDMPVAGATGPLDGVVLDGEVDARVPSSSIG